MVNSEFKLHQFKISHLSLPFIPPFNREAYVQRTVVRGAWLCWVVVSRCSAGLHSYELVTVQMLTSHHGLCSLGPHTLLLGSDTRPFWVDQLALSHCWAPLGVPWGILCAFWGLITPRELTPTPQVWHYSLSHCCPPRQAPRQGIHLVAFKKWWPGLPWWLSGGESACQCRKYEFNPWSGRIPHAEEQLSPCITTMEPVFYSPGAAATEPKGHNSWSPCFCNKTRHRNKKTPCRN